jgi:hypothetical protein
MVHANEEARKRKLSDGAICLLSRRPWPYQDEALPAQCGVVDTADKGVDQRRSLIYCCSRRDGGTDAMGPDLAARSRCCSRAAQGRKRGAGGLAGSKAIASGKQ